MFMTIERLYIYLYIVMARCVGYSVPISDDGCRVAKMFYEEK